MIGDAQHSVCVAVHLVGAQALLQEGNDLRRGEEEKNMCTLYYIFSVKNLISFVTFDEGTVLDIRFEFFLLPENLKSQLNSPKNTTHFKCIELKKIFFPHKNGFFIFLIHLHRLFVIQLDVPVVHPHRYDVDERIVAQAEVLCKVGIGGRFGGPRVPAAPALVSH